MNPPNSASFEAWASALGVTGAYTSIPTGRAARVPGGPARLALAAFTLRPFLRSALLSQLAEIGVPATTARQVAGEIRSPAGWSGAWGRAAVRHEARGKELRAAGQLQDAYREFVAAYGCARMQIKGDGRLFFTPMAERLANAPERRRLYGLVTSAEPGKSMHVQIPYRGDALHGLLHEPSGAKPGDRRPGILLIHGATGEKEVMDLAGSSLRRAGSVTLAVDLPAHGESADGPRLQPDEDAGFMAWIDLLAAEPAVDPDRLAAIGASFGGYVALRLAAADPRLRAVVDIASPYVWPTFWDDPGRRDSMLNFMHLVGAASRAEAETRAARFTLAGRLSSIRCPVFLGYATLDRLVPFTDAYRISRELPGPQVCKAFAGAGHEVADLTAVVLASFQPWLLQQLNFPA